MPFLLIGVPEDLQYLRVLIEGAFHLASGSDECRSFRLACASALLEAAMAFHAILGHVDIGEYSHGCVLLFLGWEEVLQEVCGLLALCQEACCLVHLGAISLQVPHLPTRPARTDLIRFPLLEKEVRWPVFGFVGVGVRGRESAIFSGMVHVISSLHAFGVGTPLVSWQLLFHFLRRRGEEADGVHRSRSSVFFRAGVDGHREECLCSLAPCALAFAPVMAFMRQAGCRLRV